MPKSKNRMSKEYAYSVDFRPNYVRMSFNYVVYRVKMYFNKSTKKLHVDKYKLHATIIMLHVCIINLHTDILYLAGRGHNYVTMFNKYQTK